MTGAHNEKVIERALEIATGMLFFLDMPMDRGRPPATEEEIREFLITKAYEELGYTKDSLGRWCEP